jgi:hypothetical protein
MGPGKTISAQMVRGVDGATTVSVQIRFGRSRIGALFVTTGAPWFSLDVTVVGANNTIARMDALRDITIVGERSRERYESRGLHARTLTRGYRYAGYLGELESFISAIQGKSFGGPTFQDELMTYEMLEGIESRISARA